MNVHKILFSFAITLTIFASVVSAQNTHMGVTPDNMVVLQAACTTSHLDCDSSDTISSGTMWNRILSDGSWVKDFKIPERKILVITDYEWGYTESTVLEDSANEPIRVVIGYSSVPAHYASVSGGSLIVTPKDQLSTQGHAFGSGQMTTGFVTSILPRWTLNRSLSTSGEPSTRTFYIILRGYLVSVS